MVCITKLEKHNWENIFLYKYVSLSIIYVQYDLIGL